MPRKQTCPACGVELVWTQVQPTPPDTRFLKVTEPGGELHDMKRCRDRLLLQLTEVREKLAAIEGENTCLLCWGTGIARESGTGAAMPCPVMDEGWHPRVTIPFGVQCGEPGCDKGTVRAYCAGHWHDLNHDGVRGQKLVAVGAPPTDHDHGRTA